MLILAAPVLLNLLNLLQKKQQDAWQSSLFISFPKPIYYIQ